MEELVSEFKKSEFGRIVCQPCFADKPHSDWDSVSYKIVDGMWQRAENPRNREYAKMFRNAGVMSINRRSTGEIELGIAAQSNHRSRRYVIQLFRDPGHMSNTIKECIDDFEDIDCGWCKVSIDDSFWIRYQWYPEDLDPELTQAGASGEIGWDEWQERSRAADDACMKAGLLEQGYDLDAN